MKERLAGEQGRCRRGGRSKKGQYQLIIRLSMSPTLAID